MRLLIGCILLWLFVQGCSSKHNDIVTTPIPVAAMKEDLKTLKKILYSAHAGLFAYNTPASLNRLFDSIEQQLNTPMPLPAFYTRIDCIIDRLRCLHSITRFPDEFYDSIYKRSMFFPLPLIVIDDKLYVNSNAYKIPLGAEIIAINHTKASVLIDRLRPLAHTDGFSNRMRNSAVDLEFAINYYLTYGARESFNVQYLDAATGESGMKHWTAAKLSDINKDWYDDTWYYFSSNPAYDLEMRDELQTAIMRVRTFDFGGDPAATGFEHFLQNSFRLIQQSGIRHLILDCRNNGGGYYSSAYELLSYLHPKPMQSFDSIIRRFDVLPYTNYIVSADSARAAMEDSVRVKFKEIRKGIYAQVEDEIEPVLPKRYLFSGKVYVLIDGQVASAASDIVAILKEQPNVKLYGEETGGSCSAHNSFVYTYELPNSKLRIDVPTKRYYQPVRATNNLRGVEPHKTIALTVDDLKNNYDPVLSYVIDSCIAN